jgi:hypothetical protein
MRLRKLVQEPNATLETDEIQLEEIVNSGMQALEKGNDEDDEEEDEEDEEEDEGHNLADALLLANDDDAIRKVYTTLCADRNEGIKKNEFEKALRALGIHHLGGAALDRAFAKLDSDNSGGISFVEFRRGVLSAQASYMWNVRITALTTFAGVVTFWYSFYDFFGGMLLEAILEWLNPSENTRTGGVITVVCGVIYMAASVLAIGAMGGMSSAVDLGDEIAEERTSGSKYMGGACCAGMELCDFKDGKIFGNFSCVVNCYPLDAMITGRRYTVNFLRILTLNYMGACGCVLWLSVDMVLWGFADVINPDGITGGRIAIDFVYLLLGNIVLIGLGQMTFQFGLWSSQDGRHVIELVKTEEEKKSFQSCTNLTSNASTSTSSLSAVERSILAPV